jgi:hypothetical protein
VSLRETRKPDQSSFLGQAFASTLIGVVALAIGGCASSPRATMAPLFANLPRPVLVSPGQELLTAERVAAEHEGDFALAGAGRSMEPIYRAGTAIVVHPTSYFMLRAGQPVVYVNGRGRQVAHILLEKTPRGWLAIGAANVDPDDDLVTSQNLAGVITFAFASSETRSSVARETFSATADMRAGMAPRAALLQ